MRRAGLFMGDLNPVSDFLQEIAVEPFSFGDPAKASSG
jgi:hypothetical protein